MPSKHDSFFVSLISNLPLTNVLFAIVLVVGAYSYVSMPRQQDPDINFNWVEISVALPGATTEDVEKQVTDVIEEGLANLQDVRFVSSSVRSGLSTTLVRFDQLGQAKFDKRVSDLRREVQNAERDLPEQATSPNVVEITTSTGFPTLSLLIQRESLDEDLYYHAKLINEEVKKIEGVNSTWLLGHSEPEIHINLNPSAMANYGIDPNQVVLTLRQSLRDLSVGSVDINNEKWQLSLNNSLADLDKLSAIPLLQRPDVYIGNIADLSYAREKRSVIVSSDGKPAIQLNLFKSPGVSVIDMTDRVLAYLQTRNTTLSELGIEITLLDDQSPTIRKALNIMETNSIIGLLLVLLSTWVFLGTRIAIFCTMGIPFVMCLVFICSKQLGQSLNVSVLLGLVMSVGIIVDNMIVVAESIRYKLREGYSLIDAAVSGLGEVIKPLTSGVTTTIAAFAPLMLVEGILGQFLLVIPLVVTVALLMSMIEAYWILPSHAVGWADTGREKPGRLEKWRSKTIHTIQRKYLHFLVQIFRYPAKTLIYFGIGLGLACVLVIGGIAAPSVHNTFFGRFFLKIEFFAFDPLRLAYVDINMPNATSLEQTMDVTELVEQRIRKLTPEADVRGISSYSGIQFNDQGIAIGSNLGQILISLLPKTSDRISIKDLSDQILTELDAEELGADSIGTFILQGGPPKTKPIQLNVLGDDFASIRAAITDLKKILASIGGVHSIEIDDNFGQRQLQIRYNHEAILKEGISYQDINDLLAVVSNGLVITEIQNKNESTDIRVIAENDYALTPGDILDYRIKAQDGSSIPLSRYVQFEAQRGLSKINHFDYRRNIRIEAESDQLNEQEAQNAIFSQWSEKYAKKHPSIELDASGILDDLNEALGSLFYLFLLGILLIYLILCNEFRSYFKPLLILTTLPMAFMGVVFGLLLSNQPLSLYTMYGVVALTGISVNASIVLIDAIERRRAQAMPLLHAILYASRRRVLPIIITSLTTMAGLFSLATGIGGKSLVWGPVAVAIVWGVGFSATMTLILIPYLYLIFHRKKDGEEVAARKANEEAAASAPSSAPSNV